MLKYTDIPEDYKPLDPGIKKCFPASKDSLPEDIVMTTMPPTRILGDPHNRTEWIARNATMVKVLSTPGFPWPVPKPDRLSYVVKETEKMGKGVFATRNIRFGELIVAERPLIVVPANINILKFDPPVHYTKEQQQRIILMEWEKKLEIVVEERMKEEDRKAFKELQNSHTEDGSGPIVGVIRTNGFGILGDFDKDDFAVTGSYSAIGKIGSRINHRYCFFSNSIHFFRSEIDDEYFFLDNSCMPNISCTFSSRSFSLQFTAVKDIKAGEQLFYSYTPQELSAQARQRYLAPYGIVCECYACANATPESDRLHEEISQRINHFIKLSDEWVKRPRHSLTEKILEPVVELDKAIKKEGLETGNDYMLLFIVFHKVYMRLGLAAKAKKYEVELLKVLALPRPN